MSRTAQELINQSLPKWPQMLVTGKSVTVEQAKEIIFRTDRFLTDPSRYSGGNNHAFDEHYRKQAGLDTFDTDVLSEMHKQFAFSRALREHFNLIDTEYVHNDWASCCFIGGPNGWCSPTGKIHFRNNVGKWPNITDVLTDWDTLVTAFPYLDLHVTLMDNESGGDPDGGDPKPVVNIRVVDGKVELMEPDLSVHHLEYDGCRPTVADMVESLVSGSRREIGLPMNWYEQFAARIQPFALQYATDHQ